MASVYRRKLKDGKRERVWRFKYKDSTGRWRYGTGWTTRQKTLDHARNLEAEHRAVRKGEKEAPASWQKYRNKPIQEVIDDYLDWGKAQGGLRGRPWDDEHARQQKLNLRRWVQDLGLTVLRNIDLPRVEKIIHDTLQAGKSAKTAQNRVGSLKSLCWKPPLPICCR